MRRLSRSGFSLLELIIVVTILAMLAGVMAPRVSGHMASSRDARRLADIKILRNAIELYRLDHGTWPEAGGSAAHDNWDVSHDGDFITALRAEGYIDEVPADPVNDDRYHYRYFVYDPGSFGCNGETEFYVLGIRNFENPEFGRRNRGFFRCANRNWGDDFAFVTGGGANHDE